MRIFLDDTPCDLDATSVGEAVVAVAALAEQSGRMIIEVHVDGERWTEGQLADLSHDETPAGEVRMISIEPRHLVAQTLADAGETLAGVDELHRTAAEQIEANQSAEAMNTLGNAVARWLEVQQAITLSSQLLAVDLDALEVKGTPAGHFIDALNQRLRMVRSALQTQDPIGLTDTLLYELPEVVQEWRDLVSELRETILAGEQP
jgi:hypothetical protein